MDSKKQEHRIECDCRPGCYCKIFNSRRIRSQCLTAEYTFHELEHVTHLQDDLKKGIKPRLLDGKTLKEVEIDFFEYRVNAITSANNLILNIEKCPCAREIIKGTDYEKMYFEAKEKHSEAIDRLMKISEEDILLLKKDHHYEIDL
ncbi:uncharacterized protein LOC130673513 [Microplitis mediator]|uniref:uncharacterized protein LOC130673513 n=1 Tax=Microplitis mediator TaxID=375433 RepID=UPI002555DEE5|nr:uncharacterized protein LOC130673513 [Microplitis mediator]